MSGEDSLYMRGCDVSLEHSLRQAHDRQSLTTVHTARWGMRHSHVSVTVALVYKKPEKPETRLFIDGEFVEATGAEWLDDYDPATEQLICRIREASTDDVDKAVRAAARAFPEWAYNTNGARRSDLLRTLGNLILENAEELACLESYDSGKPFANVRDVEMKSVARILYYYAGWADKIVGDAIPISSPEVYFCYTRREPVGVVAAIIPWNYPLYLLTLKLAPALACGCTIVIKTSEKTPLSALLYAKFIQKANFPKGVVNILTGRGPTVGKSLVMHQRVDKISFTGSTATGREIARIATDALKRVTLELGGKSALLVFNDADVALAAKAAFHGLFSNSGQCCVASSRILVQEGLHDTFVRELHQLVQQQLHLVPPCDDKCNQGPLVDKLQYDRVLKYIDKGISEGAKLVCGGKPKDGRGYWVQPTIFTDVTDDMVIAKEEIFGPVICILKFTSVDEAIERANASDYGLGAGVCTNNMAIAYRCSSRLRVGSIFINCYNYTDIAAPFGGYKHSGYGREGGEEGLLPYLEVKTLFARLS